MHKELQNVTTSYVHNMWANKQPIANRTPSQKDYKHQYLQEKSTCRPTSLSHPLINCHNILQIGLDRTRLKN